MNNSNAVLVGKRIEECRQNKRESLEEIGKIVGVNKSTVLRWERGETEKVGLPTIKMLASHFGVNPDWLSGKDVSKYSNIRETDVFSIPGISPPPKTYKVPRLGTIACGEPILAEENIEDYDEVPENIHCNFTLKCKGDSMIGARINDGDIVYIRLQEDVENGEIAAVLIDEAAEISEATLKRVYKYPDHIELHAENPKVQTMIYIKEDMNRVRIVGKAVGFTSVIK